MRSTKHIGKLVLSRNPAGPDLVAVSGRLFQVQRLANAYCLQIRPAQRIVGFKPDVTYLIVGGLKGLCGSLAVEFAKKGAKHLAVMSRSGCDDPQSQFVLRQLQGLGCQVDLLRGDVTEVEDVRRVFSETTVPVAGIIQGAMVLRVSQEPTCLVYDERQPLTANYAIGPTLFQDDRGRIPWGSSLQDPRNLESPQRSARAPAEPRFLYASV